MTRLKTSDGDTCSLANVNEAQPYGEDLELDKEECVNHISKRMSKGLKEAADACKIKGIKLGGRGEGTLTENAINTPNSYYR